MVDRQKFRFKEAAQDPHITQVPQVRRDQGDAIHD